MYKLLILGATYHEIDIIYRARIKGIYTIVTDLHTDWSESPAKFLADEAWNLSWSDLAVLVERCKESKVNGVLAGFSEFRVENMIKLCAALHLPCALSMEQLDITRDKIKFKNLCQQYDIPVVPEYQFEDKKSYPVIIKPVDRAGSIGINVANSDEEFYQYYHIAKELSPSGKVVIEDFIDDGIKVDLYYYVKDGNPILLGTSDTIMCEGTLGAKILQKAWIFPSRYQDRYLSSIDFKVKKMLVGICIRNGYATMSAFYRKNHFYFFEAGFRLSGELSYNYYQHLSGINYIDTLIDYALGINNTDNYVDCYDFSGNMKSVILNFFGLNGQVKRMVTPQNEAKQGLNLIPNYYIKKNDTIENQTNVFQKIAMFTILSEKEDDIVDVVKSINSDFRVLDSYNQDLVYERVSIDSLGYTQKHIRYKEHDLVVMHRPYWITWKELQSLLDDAHETNFQKGLVYATYKQSIDLLKEKSRHSICLVIFVDGCLAATATIQFRSLNYWYHQGIIGLLKLLAVHPKYRGHKLGLILTRELEALCLEKHIEVIVLDSAEENITVRKLCISEGFKIVDCCKYPENNFVSTVYAKWLGIPVPHTDELLNINYSEKRKSLIEH